MMRKTSIIKIRPLKLEVIRGAWDTDMDGVPNDRDCVWYDPNRQDRQQSLAIGKDSDELVDWLISENTNQFAFDIKSKALKLKKAWEKRGYKTKLFKTMGPTGRDAWTVISYR